MKYLGNLARDTAEFCAGMPDKTSDQAKYLKDLADRNCHLTRTQFAIRCNRSANWVHQRILLTYVHADIVREVDDGTIKIMNASLLSCFPMRDQAEHVKAARSMTLDNFRYYLDTFRCPLRSNKRIW